MSAFLNQRLTNVGWDALSIALGGGRLTFFKMQAGDGTIIDNSLIPPMTGLVHPLYDIAITSYVIEGDGQITLFGNIASKLVDTGFTFRELGIFATIEPPTGRGGTPSGPNISAIVQTPSTQANPVVPNPAEGTALMYSYCNAYAASDYIPGKNESTDVVNTVQVTIKIDEAENVQINVLAGQTFSVVNIGPPSVGAGPWSYTQANVGYFKRLVKGYGTEIVEDTNTITIGQKALTQDLDTFVALGNPDIPPHFSTIQKAHDWLLNWFIPTNIIARINVSAGTWQQSGSSNSTIIIHPNASQIQILGTTPIQTTCTAITNVDAGRVNITLADASQFAVGDIIRLETSANDIKTDHRWRGGHQVQAKAGNVLTCSKNNVSGVDFTGSQVSLACKVWKYPTVLRLNGQNTDGIACYSGTSLGLVQNLTIIGDSTINQRGLLSFIKQVNHYIGYSIEQGCSLTGDDCIVGNICNTSCKWGLVATLNASIRSIDNVEANGCTLCGVWAIGGSLALGSLVTGNSMSLTTVGNYMGISGQQMGAITAGRLASIGNTYGAGADFNASIQLGPNGFVCSVWGNRYYDLVAQARGFVGVWLNGGAVVNCSPASGTVGNDQGYIIVRP